jgi:dTDP-4-amino-4,6-dideoxy-D-galactose acyltransferase
MQLNIIEPLEWDSRFFGYPIVRIVFDQIGSEYQDKLLRQLTLEKVRLAYLFVPPSEKILNKSIIRKGGILVDKKTLFSKEPERHLKYANNIIEFNDTELNGRLIELVLLAGLYSRFNIDKKFTSNEYEKLYIEWLKKSLEKKLALKTFVATIGTDIVGLTTFGKKKEHADIGLVSVDEKFRGLGIASDLIHYADNAAFDYGYNKIEVVTQLDNVKACKLYEKCNFQIESILNIYHYWL